MSVFNAPLFYVRGNHDYSFDLNPPEGGDNIHGKVISFKGLTIVGFEGSMFYHHPKPSNTRSGNGGHGENALALLVRQEN